MKRDYYEILEISKTASDGEIKKAYRRLAMELHPDRNPGNREAEERFKEAAEAYQVLSDPEKRQRYDRFGHQGVAGASSGFGGFSNFEDIFSAFSDIFGGNRVSEGEDLQETMELDFFEAAKGTKKEIEVQRHTRCTTCQGSGAKPGTKPTTCRTCHGQGQVAHRQGFFTIATECTQCHGQGVIIHEKCPTCRGNTQIPETAKVLVQVPAGVDDGTRLRMPGLGDASSDPRGQPGDLYILFRVKPDERFRRKGDDLWVDVALTFAEAALGTTVRIPTLDGEENIAVEPGTQPMQERVLPKRGVPNVRGRGHGNLIVRFIVKVPKKLASEAKSLVEQLAPHLGPTTPASEAAKDEPASAFQRLFRGKKKT